MKLVTLFLTTCMCCSATYAQPGHQPSSFDQIVRMTRSINAATIKSKSKTTAIKQRLIKSASWSGSAYIDTTVYRYDFGRGSEFDFDNMTYQDVVNFPNTEGVSLVMYDSMHRTTTTMSASSISAKYKGGLRVQQVFNSSAGLARMNWTVNSQGQVTEMVGEMYSSSAGWLPNERDRYGYDAAGRLVVDTNENYVLGSWRPIRNITYHYNAANQIDTMVTTEYTGGQWLPKRRYCYAYTSGQMTYSLAQVHNNTNWDDAWRMDIAYTGNQKVNVKKEQWSAAAWILQSEEHRHLNTGNLPDSIFWHGNTGFSWDTVITKVVYNSFGNPETISYHLPDMTQYAQGTYWYQDYDPQGVKEIAAVKTLQVYPNPAKDHLHIATSDVKRGSINYTIINSLGQTMLSGSDVVKNDKMSMDIRQLSPGVHWLQLQDVKGQWYKATFSKVQ